MGSVNRYLWIAFASSSFAIAFFRVIIAGKPLTSPDFGIRET